jgi:uncharacterized protein
VSKRIAVAVALVAAACSRDDTLKKPLFWEIAKDGKTTYALGTIHVGVNAEKRLPRVVWDKLAAEPTFAMETDLHDPALVTMGQRGSGTIHDDLGPVYWKKLETALSTDVAQQIDRMTPMIPATLLSLKGLPQTPPMDGVLHDRAQRDGKKLVYLEKAADEIAVLEHVMDVRMLKTLLDEPDLEKETRELIEAYVAGDDAKMVAINAGQRDGAMAHGFTAAELDELDEELLYRRNSAWIPAIERLHEDGGGFIAVGALHLVGKRSVLSLLEAKGYRIQRVAP